MKRLINDGVGKGEMGDGERVVWMGMRGGFVGGLDEEIRCN